MRIREIYLQELACAQKFLELSCEENISREKRYEYCEMALETDKAATQLAHCIAMFGDANIDEIKFDEAMAKVKDMSCEFVNQWQLGLDHLKSLIVTTFKVDNKAIYQGDVWVPDDFQ